MTCAHKAISCRLLASRSIYSFMQHVLFNNRDCALHHHWEAMNINTQKSKENTRSASLYLRKSLTSPWLSEMVDHWLTSGMESSLARWEESQGMRAELDKAEYKLFSFYEWATFWWQCAITVTLNIHSLTPAIQHSSWLILIPKGRWDEAPFGMPFTVSYTMISNCFRIKIGSFHFLCIKYD